MADAPASCNAVDLGAGTTPKSPCSTLGVDPFSVQWCTAYDVVRLNDVVRVERNHLVRLINRFVQEVNDGKAKWDARLDLAWDLEDEALQLTHSIPATWAAMATDLNWTPAQAASQLALMAQRVHAASCGVEQAFAEASIKLPPAAVIPDEPDGIVDSAVKVAKKAAEGSAWVAGGIVVVALAVGFASSRRRR